jgi:mannose-1-phosphate guanylyltransferase
MLIQPIILCGGQGTRLWPLSRKNKPKQFLKIFNKKSLFELTLERVVELKKAVEPIIVTDKAYEFFIKNSLSKMNITAKIILEPEGKNTTSAIYLAAKEMSSNHLMLIMPSDHIIKDKESFITTVNKTSKCLLTNYWITFGIVPNYPSTAYGYIELKKIKKETLLEVISFKEKPSIAKATEMYLSNNFLWNCGIYMASRNHVLSSIKEHARSVSEICDKVFEKKVTSKKNNSVTYNLVDFEKIPSISIDFSVMEKENKIKCIILNNDWCDVGSWDSALKFVDKEKHKKNIIEINGKNDIFCSKGRMIATIGVNDLIIVDSKDATLISRKDESENVKKVISKIKLQQLNFLEDSLCDERPWGHFEVLLNDVGLKVKKLTVKSKQRISLQYHNQRSEHWFVASGTAHVFLDGRKITLSCGESIDIKKKARHYIENLTQKDLEIIEVQIGDYLGEDDIIRIKDPYER